MKTAERVTAGLAPSHKRRWVKWLFIGLSSVVAAGGLLVLFATRALAPPKLPSLAKHPDASLSGAVAYIRNKPQGGWCLTVAPASGAKSTDLICGHVSDAPDLVRWFKTDKVQIFQTAPGATRYGKEIDPRSKLVTVLADTAIPSFEKLEPPNSSTRGNATVSVRSTESLHELILTSPSGSRTLMTLKSGSMEFPYAIFAPRWSADGAWVLTSDSAGRLLLVTVGPPSAARVLVEKGARGGRLYDPAGPSL